MKSPKEARQQLCTALRSGKYVQGKGALERKNPDTGETYHCCLGVACREFIADGGQLSVTYPLRDSLSFFDGTVGNLPLKVMRWLGFSDKFGTLVKDISSTSLISMNDNGATFEEIATIIEDGKVCTNDKEVAEATN